jgi:hypothetical protein
MGNQAVRARVCVRLMRSMRLSVFKTQEQTLHQTGSGHFTRGEIHVNQNVKLLVANESSHCTRVSPSEGTGNNV